MNGNGPRRPVHGPLTLIVLGLIFAAGVGNLSLLGEIRGQAAAMNLTTKGRTYCYQILYLTDELLVEREDRRKEIGPEMQAVIDKMDDRFLRLRAGDQVLGLPAASSEKFLQGIADREKVWRESIKPKLETILRTTDLAEQKKRVDDLETELKAFAMRIQEGALLHQESVEGRIETLQLIQYVMVAVVLILAIANLLGSGWLRKVR